MVTFGKGGWTYDVVYNLPVFLRNYYMKLLTEVIEKEKPQSTKKQTYSPPIARG